MNQVFKYAEELNKKMQQKFEAALELTIRDLLDELTTHYIQRKVYNMKKGTEYKRTYVLLKMFEASDVYYHGGTYGGVYGGIQTNDDIFMQYQNPEKWQNESKYDESISAADFVNIINNGVTMLNDGTRKHSIFGERPATKFWEDFLDFATYREYKILLVKHLKELGVDVKGIDTASKAAEINRSGTIQIKRK